jgi:tetratricopeptide (TPR) repeat protein
MIGGVIDDEYYIQTASQWMDIDNYKRAILNLEIALKTYDVSNVRYYLAWCYQNIGEFEKAYMNYENAYNKKKQNIYLIYMAYCKHCLGKHEDSINLLNDLKNRDMDSKTKSEFNRIESLIHKSNNN